MGMHSPMPMCLSVTPITTPFRRQARRMPRSGGMTHSLLYPQENGSSMVRCWPSHFSRLLDSPRRMWRHRSLSSSCPKPACQNPGAAHDLTGSGGKLRDNAEHLRTCGPGFLSACYRGSGALGHKNTQVLVLGRFKSLSGGIISLTVKRGSEFLD